MKKCGVECDYPDAVEAMTDSIQKVENYGANSYNWAKPKVLSTVGVRILPFKWKKPTKKVSSHFPTWTEIS